MPVHGVDLEDGTFNRLSKRTFQVSMWTRVNNRQGFHDREGVYNYHTPIGRRGRSLGFVTSLSRMFVLFLTP